MDGWEMVGLFVGAVLAAVGWAFLLRWILHGHDGGDGGGFGG